MTFPEIPADGGRRFKLLAEADMTPRQREAYHGIVSGPRKGALGPFNALLRSPDAADRVQRVGEYVRFHSVIPAPLNEMAILMAGRAWSAQFEFWAHARLGRQAGLPDDVIEAIRTGAAPSLGREDLQAIHDVVSEHFATNRVSQPTYDRAIAVLGEGGLVDVIGIVGYYGLVSMTLNTFEVGLPEGETNPFV